jgi:hypothetical protein
LGGKAKEGGHAGAGTVDEMRWQAGVTCMVHLHLFNHIQFQEQMLRSPQDSTGSLHDLYASLCSIILSKSPSVVFGFVCPNNLRTNGRNVVLN